MIVMYDLDPSQMPTEEQKQRISEACKRQNVFDEDCPDSTPMMLEAFHQAARTRNRRLAGMKAEE